MGHEVTVVTANAPFKLRRRARQTDAENLREHGYRTVRLGISMPIRGNGSVARCAVGIGLKARVAKALEGMDVVHSQGMAHPSICLWALRVATGPVNVGTFHTYFEGGGGHWGYRYLFAYVRSTVHRTDRMIVVSEACITALRPYFRDQPFQIIPNGVDTDLYRPLPAEERPPGPPRILFVGRLDPRNDLRTLLDATRILADEGREFVVQVVGRRLRLGRRPPAGAGARHRRPDRVAGRAGQGAPAAVPRGRRVRRALHDRVVRGGAAGGPRERHPRGVRRQHRVQPGDPRRDAGAASTPRTTRGAWRPGSPSCWTTRRRARSGAGAAGR